MKWYIALLLSLFAVLSISLSVSSSASAWSSITTPPEYTFDIASKIDGETNGGTWGAWSNWRDRNYAVFEYNAGSPTGTVILAVWNDSDEGVAEASGITIVSSSFLCRWTFDGGYLYGCQGGGGGMNAGKLYGIKLNRAWLDNHPAVAEDLPPAYIKDGSGDFDNNVTPRCEPWDVACWFSATVSQVVDGFQSLANFIGNAFKALGEWIANLIMPSNADGSFDNRFTALFTTINDTMHERLGILLFPFDFVTNMVTSITSIWNPYGHDQCTSRSEFSIPNLLGSAGVSLSLCSIENTPVWNPMKVLIRIAWVIGLVGLLHHKYMSLMKGDQA